MIVASGLTKTYGTKTAVDGISFTVEPGRVTGFLGPNGSGKSTTMPVNPMLLDPWVGFAVFTVEVAAVLLAGYLVLRRRDA